MNTGFRKRRRGILAAASVLAVAAGIAVASVAGAAEETKIYVSDTGGTTCFASAGQAPCAGSYDVTVNTGDKVTWEFAGATMPHNVASPQQDSSVPPDDAWTAFKPTGNPPWHPAGAGGTDSFTFGKAGVYRFVCQLHPGMEGTVTVKGEPVEVPTSTATATPTFSATATATATATASAAPTATPDDHTSTPKPGHATAKDTAAPSLQRASVKSARGGARLRFWLSEPAKVSIELVRKGAKSSSVSKVVQSPAGTRAFVLRTGALERGTYTARLTPIDAMGNKGATTTASLRFKR